MRKIFKKFAALVATAAMTVAMCATAFAADVYHVAGDEGLTGASWDTTQNEMTAKADGTYEITFKDVKAGEYGFKVLKGDAWGDAYNLEGEANGMGDDAKVTVDTDGSTVVVSFDGTKASVMVLEPGVSLGGDDNQAETAAPADTTPSAPQTADSTPVVAAVVAMLAMGCAVVALNAKKSR